MSDANKERADMRTLSSSKLSSLFCADALSWASILSSGQLESCSLLPFEDGPKCSSFSRLALKPSIEVPVPQPEILVTAATTAVISVAATLTATSVFKYLVTLMKPIIKTAWTKLTKRKQDSSNSSSSSGQQDS